MSAIDDLFDDKIRPHMFIIKKMLENNKSTRAICETIGISMGEWKICKENCPDLVELVEDIKGRNSEFYEKVLPYLDKIEKMILDGDSLTVVAKSLGISGSTLSSYFKVHLFFDDFWKRCHDKKIEVVSNSVYKRAKGYTFQEKKESMEEGEYLYDANGNEIYETNPNGSFRLKDGKKIHKRKRGKIKLEKITKELPGDMTAAAFFLTNKSDWKRKDSEDEIDPLQLAKEIRENLNDMENTVPKGPEMTPVENVMDVLSNMTKEELKSLVPVIQRVVEDVV